MSLLHAVFGPSCCYFLIKIPARDNDLVPLPFPVISQNNRLFVSIFWNLYKKNYIICSLTLAFFASLSCWDLCMCMYVVAYPCLCYVSGLLYATTFYWWVLLPGTICVAVSVFTVINDIPINIPKLALGRLSWLSVRHISRSEDAES